LIDPLVGGSHPPRIADRRWLATAPQDNSIFIAPRQSYLP
jgi:hypothetical protein